MTLDANTPPEDVISVHSWTTRTAIREKLLAAHDWHPDTLTGTPGLGFVVLELTRDFGLEDHLRDYGDHLKSLADRLKSNFASYGERYSDSIRFCERVHTLLRPENGGRQMLSAATLDIELATNDARLVGEPKYRDRHPDWNLAMEDASQRNLAIALITNLQAKRLI